MSVISATAYIDLDAILYNYRLIKSLVGGRVAAVVKADAYGHGLVPVARALEREADCFCVANLSEAVKLRTSGIKKPVFVLGYGGAAETDGAGGAGNICAEAAAEFGLIQAAYSLGFLRELDAAARRKKLKFRIHIKLDTGMNRLGIKSAAELESCLGLLSYNPRVLLSGAFTHFCSPSDAEYTAAQYCKFSSCLKYFKPFKNLSVHAAATGTLLNPAFRFGAVRAGLCLYGYGLKGVPLKKAMTVKADVIQTFTIGAGERAGYGGAFKAEKETLAAVIAAGYGDGIKRSLSGRGYVTVGGERRGIIGNVCMDTLTADVTGLKCAAADVATVMGDADAAAELAGTVPYEILTGFSNKRVLRVYRGGGF